MIHTQNENVNSENLGSTKSGYSVPKTVLDWARRYVSMGWSVIPIQRGKKIPALETWKEYQYRLPTDTELVEWFASNRQSIAVVCGKVSGGHFVIEIDDSPNALKELTRLFSFLHTSTLMGVSKRGLHIHLQCESLPNYVTHITRKHENGTVEFRGNGTITILSPSIHPSGTRYTCIPGLTLKLLS